MKTVFDFQGRLKPPNMHDKPSPYRRASATPFSLRLGDAQQRELQELSSQTGLTQQELIRRAIDDYLEAQKAKRAAQT